MARSSTTADVFNAIGDAHRRDILDTLNAGEKAVGAIVHDLSMSQRTGVAGCTAWSPRAFGRCTTGWPSTSRRGTTGWIAWTTTSKSSKTKES